MKYLFKNSVKVSKLSLIIQLNHKYLTGKYFGFAVMSKKMFL
jgi:hypothetical protein